MKKNKLCIVITGLPSAGKTFVANRLTNRFRKKELKTGYIDITCLGRPTYQNLVAQIELMVGSADNDIVIIETHPPYLYNLGNEPQRQTIYIHLKVDHERWKSNSPLNKKTNFKFGNMFFGDFVKKCFNDKVYYNGASDIYECSCVRDGYKNNITAGSVEEAIEYVIDFIGGKR